MNSECIITGLEVGGDAGAIAGVGGTGGARDAQGPHGVELGPGRRNTWGSGLGFGSGRGVGELTVQGNTATRLSFHQVHQSTREHAGVNRGSVGFTRARWGYGDVQGVGTSKRGEVCGE